VYAAHESNDSAFGWPNQDTSNSNSTDLTQPTTGDADRSSEGEASFVLVDLEGLNSTTSTNHNH
jgi:hypothetical protein